MSTSSITRVIDNDEILVNIHRHSDGYPDVHGMDLVEFMRDRKIVSGIGEITGPTSNGFEDLAAQLVVHLKKNYEVGGIYLLPAEDVEGEYQYDIIRRKEDGNNVKVHVSHLGKPLFSGTFEQMESQIKARLL